MFTRIFAACLDWSVVAERAIEIFATIVAVTRR
jgi:hypothetical protein